jgi:hypothetical protein
MIESVWLGDPDGQNLAQFLQFDDHVIGIPMVALTARYLADQALPIWVPPGCIYPRKSFLGYLAQVASWAPTQWPADQYALLSGHWDRVLLRRCMQAEELARVTGYDVAEIREFLAGHLTFEEP